MLSRRTFLKATAASLPATLFVPALFERAVAHAARDGSTPRGATNAGRTLIIVQLAGGNDGRNTVVPYADGRYRDLRPTIGVKPEDAVRLDDRLGLHPALGALGGAWSAGKLAVLENVGYENPSLSHFQAMRIWETADPAAKLADGWLSGVAGGLAASAEHSLGVVNVGDALSPALCCPVVPPPTVTDPNRYRVLPDPKFP